MTIQELIERLQKLPLNLPVKIGYLSVPFELEPDFVKSGTVVVSELEKEVLITHVPE